MKRITIKDIAQELGMHHSTVSRALRLSSEVNKETRDKVLKYAALKGYQVNRNALLLRGTGSNIIGVIVPNIRHSFFSNFVSIITRMAFDSGYIVAVFQSEESVEQEKEIIKSIIQQNIAGVIASISMETTDISHIQQLDEYKIPMVGFDRISSSLKTSTVELDNQSTLQNVVTTLRSRRYTKIAYLSGNSSIHLFQERQKGYLLGLKGMATSYQKCVLLKDGFTIDQGFKATQELMEGDEKPDAIIFDSHILACGGLEYLKKRGDQLFEKMGIATFGGYPWLSYGAPNILFIQQPEDKIAKASFDLLVEHIVNPTQVKITALKFQATLI
ncbi:MAG: LacI family transcriptional regulator [Bacteroidales bacterium]|nr:LacI family transcriptional regulator [Bacteroidales bacterium]